MSAITIFSELENIKVISIDDIKKVYSFLKNEGDDDPEYSHHIEEKTMNKIFELFANGKLLKKEMLEMIELMNKIMKLPFDRWFADLNSKSKISTQELTSLYEKIENEDIVTKKDVQLVYDTILKNYKNDTSNAHMLEKLTMDKIFNTFNSSSLLKDEMIEISELMVKIANLDLIRGFA